MAEFAHAVLEAITSGKQPRTLDSMEVQFNPASLKLKLTNQIDGGRSRGRQARQHMGKSSTVLTLELVFDTADEGTTAMPYSVRRKTAFVESFVLPREKTGEAPPKARFRWGDLVVEGIVDSLDLDLDHFAADGTPLRARVGLSIKEQDPEHLYPPEDAGKEKRRNSRLPGAPQPGAPGDAGSGPGGRSALALEGETAPELAARLGLDPAAWRGLAIDLSAGLTLQAGVEVGFEASLSVSAGLGVSLGFAAGAEVPLAAAVGLDTSVDAAGPARRGAGTAAGFALAEAGGIAAALDRVAGTRVESAAQAARAAFAAPAAPAAAAPSVTPGDPALPAPAPRPDPRATGFGFGVPLRTRVTGAADERQGAQDGSVHLRSRLRPETQIALVPDPTVPPWEVLPVRDAGRMRADASAAARRPTPCECCGGWHGGRH